MERPDLSNIPQSVLEYIEFLESNIGQIKSINRDRAEASQSSDSTPLNPEPPTSAQILTLSKLGFAKRTFRHLYLPQHRGGTGNLDLEVDNVDEHLLAADLDKATTLLVFSNQGRVFRIPLTRIPEKALREQGEWIWERIELNTGEKAAAVLSLQAAGFVTMITRHGRIRSLRHHLFGEHMRPGMSVFSPQEHGDLVAACWTPGDADILVSTRQGMGIRFSEKSIPPLGDQAIKLAEGDEIASLAPVYDQTEVFIASADGRGATRAMNGFAPNKKMGGSGKILMKSNAVVGVVPVRPDDHIFELTRQGKIIRFPAHEVPVTEAPVQGVNCILLRGDEVISVIKSGRNG